jgi:hypothetical protein
MADVRATIVYYDPPRRPPDGTRPDFASLPLSGKVVPVTDMRGRESGFSADREGFAFVRRPSLVGNLYDRDEVEQVCIREVGELLRAVTGCRATAMLNSPVVRVSRRVGERPAGTTITGDFVHADFNAPVRGDDAAPRAAAGRGRGPAPQPVLDLQRLAGVFRHAAGRAACAVTPGP